MKAVFHKSVYLHTVERSLLLFILLFKFKLSAVSVGRLWWEIANCPSLSSLSEKPLWCSHCAQAFRSKCDPALHKKACTSENPDICSLCKKEFHGKSYSTLHPRIYSTEKSYVIIHMKMCIKKGYPFRCNKKKARKEMFRCSKCWKPQ